MSNKERKNKTKYNYYNIYLYNLNFLMAFYINYNIYLYILNY